MKRRLDKKGQSALEFVSMYGWSFFIVLVVMVGFAYFGLTMMSERMVDSCFASHGFVCNGFEITSDKQSVRVQSVFSLIQVVDAKLVHNQVTSDCGVVSDTSESSFFVECNKTGFKEDSKVKLVINFYYQDNKGVYEYPKEGIIRIVGTVIPSAFISSSDSSDFYAGETYNVSACSQSFQSGNVYNLMSSVVSNGSCFNINADNVVLDCNNNTLIGNADGSGIRISGKGNVVQNCFIMNFDKGISSDASVDLMIRDNSITSSTNGEGIYLNNVYNGSFISNSVSGQGSGFFIFNGENVVLSSNSIISDTNKSYSNYFSNLKNVSFEDNTFIQSGYRFGNNYALYLENPEQFVIIDNDVLSSSKTALWINGGNYVVMSDNQIQSSNSFPGFYATSLKNSYISNNVLRGQPGLGAQLSGNLSNTNFSGNIIEGDVFGALVFYGGAHGGYFNNNIIMSSGDVPAINMYEDASSRDLIFYNNQITSNKNVSISINSASENNLFYNNFIRGLVWVENYNYLNNFSLNGNGNRYYFITGSGANSLFNLIDENGDHWADSGSQVPFSSESIPAYWVGEGNDSYPYVH